MVRGDSIHLARLGAALSTPRPVWFSLSPDGQLDIDLSPIALGWRAGDGTPGCVDLGGRVWLRSESDAHRAQLGARLGVPVRSGPIDLEDVDVPDVVRGVDLEVVDTLEMVSESLGLPWLEPFESERVRALEQWARAWRMGIEDPRPTVARLRWCADHARRADATPEESRRRSRARVSDDVQVGLTSAIAQHEGDWVPYAPSLVDGTATVKDLVQRWLALEEAYGAGRSRGVRVETDGPSAPGELDDLRATLVGLESVVGDRTPARRELERAREQLGAEPLERTRARLERAQMLALPAFDVHVEDLHTPLDRGISQLRQLEARIRVGLADLERMNPEAVVPCPHILTLEVAMMASGASHRVAEIERFATALDALREDVERLVLAASSEEVRGDLLADIWDLLRVLDALASVDV